MAKFCTKCGSPIGEGMKFCSKCGAPVQGGTTQATLQTPVAQPQQQTWSASQAGDSADNGIKGMFFSTEGRLNRKPYIIRYIILCVIAAIAVALLEADSDALMVLGLLIIIGLLVAGWMLGIRRLHDLDKSGWFILLYFVPIINGIFGWYLLLVPGTNGNNQYGPDPRESR